MKQFTATRDLPDAAPAFAGAGAKAAVAAIDAGDLGQGRKLLEDALRALREAMPVRLLSVPGRGTP